MTGPGEQDSIYHVCCHGGVISLGVVTFVTPDMTPGLMTVSGLSQVSRGHGTYGHRIKSSTLEAIHCYIVTCHDVHNN